MNATNRLLQIERIGAVLRVTMQAAAQRKRRQRARHQRAAARAVIEPLY